MRSSGLRGSPAKIPGTYFCDPPPLCQKRRQKQPQCKGTPLPPYLLRRGPHRRRSNRKKWRGKTDKEKGLILQLSGFHVQRCRHDLRPRATTRADGNATVLRQANCSGHPQGTRATPVVARQRKAQLAAATWPQEFAAQRQPGRQSAEHLCSMRCRTHGRGGMVRLHLLALALGTFADGADRLRVAARVWSPVPVKLR